MKLPDKVTAQRVATIAAAARLPLAPGSAERIATGVSGPAARFAAENISLAMEVEPATYGAVARQDCES
jgi:hypothetical protein